MGHSDELRASSRLDQWLSIYGQHIKTNEDGG
jgi:hypothetical protein